MVLLQNNRATTFWQAGIPTMKRQMRQKVTASVRRGCLRGGCLRCVGAALLVCAVVATLFIDAFLSTNLKWLVGALFVISMIMLMASQGGGIEPCRLTVRGGGLQPDTSLSCCGPLLPNRC